MHSHSGQLFFLGLITALAIIKLTGCDEQHPQITNGMPVPSFKLEQLRDGVLSFPEDLQGKIVVINFWADWCPVCENEMNAIEPVYQKYQDQGLVILAINVRQGRSTVAAFINRQKITYDVLLDERGEVTRNYAVVGLPTTFILDRKGNLHTRIAGEAKPELLERIVKELL